MAQLIHGLDVERVRANLERVRDEIAAAGRRPRGRRVLAAVKYVALEELGVLGRGGMTLVGENRAQELERKASARRGADVGLHRPPAEPQGQAGAAARAADPLRRQRLRAEQLGRHGTPDTEVLVEVNVAGEEGKSGIAPDALDAFLGAARRGSSG